MSATNDIDGPEEFSEEDWQTPAELFVSRRAGSGRSGLSHHRFETAAGAIAFAIKNFAARGLNDVVMTVEDKRFNLGAVRKIHRSTKDLPVAHDNGSSI